MRYAPPLSSFVLPGLQDSFVIRNLVRLFELECPHHPPDPPVWDLVWVLKLLRGLTFDRCHVVPFGS